MPVLVMEHRGAKSGELRRTPGFDIYARRASHREIPVVALGRA
jgi:hypothetical protein